MEHTTTTPASAAGTLTTGFSEWEAMPNFVTLDVSLYCQTANLIVGLTDDLTWELDASKRAVIVAELNREVEYLTVFRPLFDFAAGIGPLPSDEILHARAANEREIWVGDDAPTIGEHAGEIAALVARFRPNSDTTN